MDNLTLEVKELKNGFQYTVKEGDTVIDTRKSNCLLQTREAHRLPPSFISWQYEPDRERRRSTLNQSRVQVQSSYNIH